MDMNDLFHAVVLVLWIALIVREWRRAGRVI